MDILDHFSIPVTGLRNGLHEFDFQIGPEFFQSFPDSPIREGDVQVHLKFDKSSELYVMDFDIGGKVRTTCDRCLEEFDLPIRDAQNLLVKFDEKEWEDADVVYILKGTQKLNVARYIYEFINLAVPITKSHDDAGERCNPEMLKFLEQQNEEETPPSANPVWDALKGFNQEN